MFECRRACLRLLPECTITSVSGAIANLFFRLCLWKPRDQGACSPLRNPICCEQRDNPLCCSVLSSGIRRAQEGKQRLSRAETPFGKRVCVREDHLEGLGAGEEGNTALGLQAQGVGTGTKPWHRTKGGPGTAGGHAEWEAAPPLPVPAARHWGPRDGGSLDWPPTAPTHGPWRSSFRPVFGGDRWCRSIAPLVTAARSECVDAPCALGQRGGSGPGRPMTHRHSAAATVGAPLVGSERGGPGPPALNRPAQSGPPATRTQFKCRSTVPFCRATPAAQTRAAPNAALTPPLVRGPLLPPPSPPGGFPGTITPPPPPNHR